MIFQSMVCSYQLQHQVTVSYRDASSRDFFSSSVVPQRKFIEPEQEVIFHKAFREHVLGESMAKLLKESCGYFDLDQPLEIFAQKVEFAEILYREYKSNFAISTYQLCQWLLMYKNGENEKLQKEIDTMHVNKKNPWIVSLTAYIN